jgi:1H-pyrrole-2-carbonyl-[peptidyl-carrier protein] brominase
MKAVTGMKRDVVIVGGGPAGAVTALYLLRAGVKPLILEKEQFPRYHIGESLTGEVGGCLRELGLEQAMTAARYPIKHGVNVYGPNGKEAFWVPVKRRDENKQLQSTTTWQVRRSRFDQALLDVAIERGAELLPCRAHAALVEDDRVTGIRIRTPGGLPEDIKAEVVVDASGQSTFLANNGAPTGPKERGRYDRQVAIFSQVVDAVRDPGDAAGNTLIFYRQKNHWAWFIPIDDEVVSVGVVVPASYLNQQKLSNADFLREQLRALNPELSRRLPELKFVENVYSASNFSYQIKNFSGKGFLCVGDSHRFIDPIFSFGVNFAMKEAQFAAAAILGYLAGERRDAHNPFSAYEARSEMGQDIIQDLVDVFWDRPLPFAVLMHHRHRDGMIDLFAGRMFSDDIMESEALRALRRCLVTQSAS